MRHLGGRPDELMSLLDELSRPGPPAIGSVLAWSAAMAAAVLAMALPGIPGARARGLRTELAELGRLDAEVYRRFLVSQESERLELLREVVRLPLEIGKRAGELRDDAVVNASSVSESMVTDAEASIRLLTFVAAETARLALTNARSRDSLQDLAEEASELLRRERERLAGWVYSPDREKP